MTEDRRERAWTPQEQHREEQAQQARVRRDARRGPAANLRDNVAHTAFAKRFAEAFRRARGA